MQDESRFDNLGVRHRYPAIQLVVTALSVLLAEGVAVGVAVVLDVDLDWQGRLLMVLSVALAVGGLLGGWVGRHLARRVARFIEVSRAWLRGTLSLRRSGGGDAVLRRGHCALSRLIAAGFGRGRLRAEDQEPVLAIGEIHIVT